MEIFFIVGSYVCLCLPFYFSYVFVLARKYEFIFNYKKILFMGFVLNVDDFS